MNHHLIPLSYSPIATESLVDVLHRFEGRSNEEIIHAFEKKLCEVTSSPYAVAVNSGTSALHLALKLAGVGSGDLVPVSTFTYVGSVNPILYCDARPVFIDCEEETWNISPTLLEVCLQELSKQRKLPKAIVVVHSYGMPAKMDEIISIANHFGVLILEDAAEALGATYKGKPIGTIGDMGVLSFNSNKTITSFGGGALLLKTKAQVDRARFLAGHAREDKSFYEHHEVGYNYRISPLSAAYGLSQLNDANGITSKINQRRNVFEHYKAQLEPSGFRFLNEPKDIFSSRWLSTVLLKQGMDPIVVQARLNQAGIESRPLWNPMHCQPAFANEKSYLNGLSEDLFSSGLCLPSSCNRDDMNKVIEVIQLKQ
jgi:dTDP-4-amino-4,6-dideoxygalactose transaminase